MATNTKEVKKEEVKKEEGGKTYPKAHIKLWNATSKAGKKFLDSKFYCGFYNTKKMNPKQPDLNIIKKNDNGKGEDYAVMWVYESSKGNKYLLGYILNEEKTRLTGFINKKALENTKQPYLEIYKSSDLPQKERPAGESVDKKVEVNEDDLPF